jgi:hypothetical protein
MATSSALNEAKALLEQNGSLSEAALLLEVAIQRGELGEGGYEAWILLGDAKTMDEHEDAGLRALIEGVSRAEAAGVPGPGMLVSIFVHICQLTNDYPNQVLGNILYERIIREGMPYNSPAVVESEIPLTSCARRNRQSNAH